MFASVWQGKTTTENAPVYFKLLTEEILPRVERENGACGTYIIQREVDGKVEFLAFILWESMELIRQFAGGNLEGLQIEPEARALLVEHDEFVRHFELTHDSISGV